MELKHIALSVTKNDLASFYINVLGGVVSVETIMSAEKAQLVFGLKQEVKVVYIDVNKLCFELFIDPFVKKNNCNYNHICVQIPNAGKLFKKALQAGYDASVHNKPNIETYFIKDSLGNLFELK